MNKILLDAAYAIALSSVPSACRNVVEIPLPGPRLSERSVDAATRCPVEYEVYSSGVAPADGTGACPVKCLWFCI